MLEKLELGSGCSCCQSPAAQLSDCSAIRMRCSPNTRVSGAEKHGHSAEELPFSLWNEEGAV